MRIINKTIRKPLIWMCFCALALAGCAKQGGLDDVKGLKGESGLNGASAGFQNAQPGSTQDFTVNVGDRVFFSLDSSSIRPDAQQTLALQARWLLRYPQYNVVIEGHADERGTREYNLALGQRRAVAVRDYLTSLGVPAERIRVISYGKERPVALCDDISCWNQNRRAVTAIDSTR